MASSPITACQVEGENVEAVRDFLFLDSRITVDGDCGHEIRRHLLLGRKAMTKLDSDCSHEIRRQLLHGRKEMTGLDSVLKSRRYSADKSPNSEGYGLPSGQVQL